MSSAKLRLVLLSCCAPCSAGAIQQLADGAIENVEDFIVLFYNPNIFPESEYTKRMHEQIKYCESLNVKYAVLEYDHDAWRDAVRGFETQPERGARCSLCFEYRFKRAVQFARENGYNAIASVLGVSRHKSQSQVDTAAEKVVSDFSHPLSVLPTSPANGGGNFEAVENLKCPPPLAGGEHLNECESGRGVANYHKKRCTERALSQSKVLKKQMTDAERLLWYYLKKRKDFSFRKQAPIDNYIVDFVCLKQKLIIEVDGTAHGNYQNRLHDTERDRHLKSLGYRILRFWNDEIFKNINMVLDTIYTCLTDENFSHPLSVLPTSPANGGGNFEETQLNNENISYLPIKWNENLRIQINRDSDFYRQNYCGCEFSIRKI